MFVEFVKCLLKFMLIDVYIFQPIPIPTSPPPHTLLPLQKKKGTFF